MYIDNDWKLRDKEIPYYTVSQKNDTDVAHYNFNAHKSILVILCRYVAEWVRYQMVNSYSTSPC